MEFGEIMSDLNIFIYGLLDPRNEIVRYVGFTSDLKRRYRKHLSDARCNRGGHRNNWIRKLFSEDILPDIIVLEKVSFEERENREKYWIGKLSKNNLTNMTEGGEGMSGHKHSLETRAAISDKKRGVRINSSKYTGTYYDEKSKKWRGRVLVNRNELVWLRHWVTEEEAAYEYDQASRIILKEKAVLNFPEEEPDLSYCLPIKGKRSSISSSKYFGVSLDKRNGNFFSWFVIDTKMFRIITDKSEFNCANGYDFAIIYSNQENKYKLNFPELREEYLQYISKYEISTTEELRKVIRIFLEERSQ